MQRRFVTCDVFTDRAFGGNPLAVVLDAQGLSAAQMQAVAREFDYAETTFVLPPADPAHTAHVRIFTPGSEVPFAGHPNVGTAFVLARGSDAELMLFEEAAGLVPVAIARTDGVVTGAELTTPGALVRGAEIAAGVVAACVGIEARDVLAGPRVLSVGLPFAVARLVDRAALGRCRPVIDAFRPAGLGGAVGVYCYVRDGDVHARMFAPLDGVPEDPATGSATAALMAHLADAEGLESFVAHQGYDMGRPSVIAARAVLRDGAVASVHVGGSCVPMFEGTFNLAGT